MNNMKLSVGQCGRRQQRRGTVIILSAVVLLVVLGIAAFTIDFGVLNVTKGQSQNAADSAAHGGMMKLLDGFGPGATVDSSTAATNAGAQATALVAKFRTDDVVSTQLVASRDVRYGRRSWNSTTAAWEKSWGTAPYNMMEVTVRRTEAVDAPINAVFATVFGHEEFDIESKAVAAFAPIVGFQLPSGSTDTIDILPIALDLTTWNNLVDQITNDTSHGFTDNYLYCDSAGYQCSSNGVSGGSDGIPEVNIYPDNNTSMPSGNRGTVDLGSPNNSTADLVRQILYGLNATDLSYFPNSQITFTDGTLTLNGDTGISAGINNALVSIIGDVRAIPIFTAVSGPGNNAQYTIVKFVGVRIMAVRLSGGPSSRHLRVQPAPFVTRNGIRGNVAVNVDSILSQPVLIE
jgi:Flp pilus assembly protein TadG